jgi:hypothetical protein
MFWAVLLTIIRRYCYVYTAVDMCHGFMFTGCWQDRVGTTFSRVYRNKLRVKYCILLVLIAQTHAYIFTHMYTQGCKIYYRKHAVCCDIPQGPAWSLFPHFQGLFIFKWFSPSSGHSCEWNYGYCPPFHDINSQRFGVWICLRLQLKLGNGRTYSVDPLEGDGPGI